MSIDEYFDILGRNRMKKITNIIIALISVFAAGCSNADGSQPNNNNIVTEQQSGKESQNTQSTDKAKENKAPAATEHIVDYSEYFQGIQGCAVIYDEASNSYSFYNKEKCKTEASPLSTFKIVSALAGLENHVLANENSTMEYSGVKYPIDAWNSNLTLKEAFGNSCVWYFRQVVDMIGQEKIYAMLKIWKN